MKPNNNSDNDLLVWADWLDENGYPHVAEEVRDEVENHDIDVLWQFEFQASEKVGDTGWGVGGIGSSIDGEGVGGGSSTIDFGVGGGVDSCGVGGIGFGGYRVGGGGIL